MARSFPARFSIFLLLVIALFIGLNATEFDVLGMQPFYAAGITSIAMATFMFISTKTLSRPPSTKRGILEIILVLGGIVLLVEPVYNYLYELNTLLNGILIGVYVLLALLVANFTKNDTVSRSELRQAEAWGSPRASRSMHSNDLSSDPRFQKMMKRRR